MNRKKLKSSLLCVVLLFFGSSVVAFGDWDPCDSYKMHFPQLPDPFGWDIAFCWAGPTEQRLELADDWQCTKTGPVNDIHFWISWEGDDVGTIESVMVCIYSNNPNGPSGWSEPNVSLWSRYFPDGTSTITVRPYGTGQQGWYDPNTGMWLRPDHNNYYQVNITDINDPFIQKEGEIYWLGIHIKAVPFPECRVGWKTAVRPQFMDDAVWRPLTGGPWMELRDPNTYESLDLSFVITGKEEPNHAKPLEPHTKWSQPPIEIDPCSTVPRYCGWDEQSHNRRIPAPNWKIVADDFRCIGSMPVTSIHWWGSFFDWEWSWAHGTLPPVLPEKWWIGFWSNVPAGINTSYSYPDILLHSVTIPAERVRFSEVGSDEYYGYYPYDICYQYNVDLNPEEAFRQDDFNEITYDNIYWISIVAEYGDACEPYYKWGWKSRPWGWMDDAVTFTLPFEPAAGFIIDPMIVNPIVDPVWGESFDMAFELDTDPNYIKWEQLYTGIRSWPHYEDEKSMFNMQNPEKERLVADDWRCVRRTPVTAVVWWGSYIGYGFEACSQGPFMPLPVQPDRFRLMIWTDVPPGDPCNPYGYSHPGEVIWQYDTDKYDEVLVGYDKKVKGIDVAICGAPSDPNWNYDVQAKLVATGQFSTVDIINVNSITPTLTQLQAYDAVLVYSDAVYADSIALGNVMADYVDSGGGVVCMMFEIGYGSGPLPNPYAQMQGRWDAQAYYAIVRASQFGPPQATLGTVYDPLHPIMQGVSSFDGGSLSARPLDPNLSTGSTLVADWSDGRPLVVTKTIGGVRRADLGFYPPSSDVRSDFWVSSTDGALLMANALTWTAGTTQFQGQREPVFRYSVRLPEEEWFHQPDYNEVFWLSVQAIYDINMPNYDWGWTNHKHVFNDDAVRYYFNPDILQWVWDELYDQTGASEDMSFMLFTDPALCSTCANYNCDARVNFLDYADFADDWLWTGSAGGYNNSDLNCDGSVDFYDLKIFVDQWLSSCP